MAVTINGSTGIEYDDNVKHILGTGDDLQINHDGTNSLIQNSTGYLGIQSDTLYLQVKTNGHAHITCVADGAVGLRYDNVQKLETKSAGISITSGQRECNLTLQNDALTWKIVNYDYGNNGTDHLGFHDGTSDRLIIHDTGEGISFNGDTASANALGDYEEGTFTVAMNFHGSGSSGSISLYSDQDLLSYTKIGRVVYITGRVRIETKSGGAGTDTSIGNLPFAAASATDEENAGVLHCYTYGTNLGNDNYNNPWLSVDPGGNKGYFYVTRNDDSWTPIAPSQWANGDYILVNGHYFV